MNGDELSCATAGDDLNILSKSYDNVLVCNIIRNDQNAASIKTRKLTLGKITANLLQSMWHLCLFRNSIPRMASSFSWLTLKVLLVT